MLDRVDISRRFFRHYSAESLSSLGRKFGVSKPTVAQWAAKGVPWDKLKYFSDSQAVSWDWIIDGREPQASAKVAKVPRSKNPRFAIAKINRRFLSLYPDMTQTEIAAILKAAVSTVNDWKRNKSTVPWHRLADAVDVFELRWDWLIDGVGPQYREQKA